MDKVASYEELIKIKLTALKIFLPILTLDEGCVFSMLDILKQVILLLKLKVSFMLISYLFELFLEFKIA